MLWGEPQRQVAPKAWILRPGVDTEVVETKEAEAASSAANVEKRGVRRGHRQPRIHACNCRPRVSSTGGAGCSGI